MVDLLIRLQHIDRRIIYSLVILSIGIPILIPIDLPVFVSPEAKGLFEAVKTVPESKLVIIAADWQAGTQGECGPQTRAVIRHLFQTGKRFAIFSIIPIGPELAQKIAEEESKGLGKKYGKDWVNWGFKAGSPLTTLTSLAKNIPGVVKTDINGTPIEKLPAMKNVNDISDVGLIAEFTGSGVFEYYLQRLQGVYGTPLVQGCTAVIAPEQYTYLQSGQLKGLLVGLRGAAEYETLSHVMGEGRRAMTSQSLAHLLVMALIGLGNIGLYASRRRRGASDGQR